MAWKTASFLPLPTATRSCAIKSRDCVAWRPISKYSRPSRHALELQIQELKTNAMVSAACGSAELRYEAKGVELRCLQPGSDVVVMADPDRLQQVLSNLLDNALRHTPEGFGGCELRTHCSGGHH